MKKLILILSILFSLLPTQYSAAETVSQKEAKRVATMFFNAAYGKVMAEPNYVYNGKRLTTNRLFSPFYVYNHPAGGFVVISAENKAFPILGYSLTENFDPQSIGGTLKALLTMYARHIENIRYDSNLTVDAEKAWQNIPGFIDEQLKAQYIATDSRISREDAMAELAFTAASYDADASTSAFYTPDQWSDMIDLELDVKGYLPLGIINEDGICPAVVHGHRGDYYRILLDGVNKQLWRLLPTEILSQGEIAVFGNPPLISDEIIEDRPFEFYDSFIAQSRAEYDAERSAIENALIISDPLVKWLGSGHYSVSLPENVESVRVFSIDGATVMTEKFRDTNVANFNLTQLPTGFYFAVLEGSSGRHWGIKLFR